MKNVILTGSFDNLKSKDLRFFQEAATFGKLFVFLWSDDIVLKKVGKKPKFPQNERKYFLDAVRYIDHTILIDDYDSLNELPNVDGIQPDIWVLREKEDSPQKRTYSNKNGIYCYSIKESDLNGFPYFPTQEINLNNKKVVVTGSFDWFHSGHIRFFEETSRLGDLYVVVGHDDNIRLLKGEGHPMLSQDERRYMVGSIKFVKQALTSSGNGWMDAEPEIKKIKPDFYAVNEDGDKPEKRAFCEQHGLEYVVFKRTPAPGLPQRTATSLREEHKRCIGL
jgi:cytidyltransferase-like protein